MAENCYFNTAFTCPQMNSILILWPQPNKLQIQMEIHPKLPRILWTKVGYAACCKLKELLGLKKSRMMPPPEASKSVFGLVSPWILIFYVRVAVSQMGIYRNMRLLGLDKIRWIVLETSRRKGFCYLFRCRVTLVFDLLIPKSNIACPHHLCRFALKWVHSFSKYRVHKFVMNKRTDARTERRTDRLRT